LKAEIIETGPEPRPNAAYVSDALAAGPFVFPSGALAATEPTGDPYQSPIRVQTNIALRRLGATLEAGGSSLDHSITLSTYFPDLDDLPGHMNVRRRYPGLAQLPSTAIQCGLVRPTATIEIDLMAWRPGHGATRELITTDAVPRPSEPSAQAVRAGPFVFLSGVMATDFKSGIPAPARVPEGLPHFGSAIKRQTAWVLEAIARVLEVAGSSLDQIVSTRVVLTEVTDFQAFDEAWREYLGRSLPARTVINAPLVNPGCRIEVGIIALAPDSGIQKEIISTPAAPVPTTAESQAVRAGDFVFASALLPTDFQTGIAPQVRIDPNFPRSGSAIDNQTRFLLSNLAAILHAAGSSLEKVVKVGAYHTRLATDLLGAMEVRREYFGDHPPASTTIQVPQLLVPESLVMIDAIAVTDD